MLFQQQPFYLRWFGSYNLSKTMVDYQINLQWLEDATLFPIEPINYPLNFDDLILNGKANNEVGETISGLCDLKWLDEKVDLSVFEDPNCLLFHPNDTETSMVEEAANLLLGSTDSNFDTSCLPSDTIKNEETSNNDVLTDFNIDFQPAVSSPGSSDSYLGSPYSSVPQAFSPVSPYSEIPESPVESAADSVEVPAESFSFDSIEVPIEPIYPVNAASPHFESSHSNAPSVISVTVYDSDCSNFVAKSDEVLSIEEISKSVRSKKYEADGKTIPKVHVFLKNSFHPYAAASQKKESRQERKKVQNKEAAARYRIKKRMEEKELLDEVTDLESEQKKLKEKHDELKSEIKYLKSLMREMLQKKGIL
ncbi:cyclic AMP-dependent transcription factor ATF-4-like [Stegodyphus dumicola]|uniref:cyclic AMP-dependent transcription factor ATF-4-like n=1 Tax=Stegodyphus dumicola TaxID=202533 RepID=UPI0015ACD3CF|nr:cyclic AMP-dependent transcription factor ATF-4-like [Stegodyphus dumicola]